MANNKMDDIYKEMRGYIDALGYDCAGFELTCENGMNILRVYVDMPGGIDLCDCEKVAREVNDYLDTVDDVLPDRYYLEVSSPGLERPLFTADDYRRFAGSEVFLTLKTSKNVSGLLKEVCDDGTVSIKTDEDERKIKLSEVRRGHLVYKEPQNQKKTFKKIKKKK